MSTVDIARKHLGISTLETRNSDRLDFHEVSVWSVKAALTSARAEGREDAIRLLNKFKYEHAWHLANDLSDHFEAGAWTGSHLPCPDCEGEGLGSHPEHDPNCKVCGGSGELSKDELLRAAVKMIRERSGSFVSLELVERIEKALAV